MAPKSSVQTIVMVILNSVPFLEIPKSRSYVFLQTAQCIMREPNDHYQVLILEFYFSSLGSFRFVLGTIVFADVPDLRKATHTTTSSPGPSLSLSVHMYF